MVQRLRSSFASLVVLREGEAIYTARFVAWLLPVAMLVLALLIIFPLMAGDLAQRVEVGVPVLAAWAVAWLLVRRGHVRWAAVVFIVGTWVVLTYAAATRGGVHSPAYAGYVLVLTYAALLVSPALAALIFVVSVAAGAAMVVAEYHTRLPLSMVVHTPTTLWATETAGMFLIVLLVVVIAHEYRRVFDRLRADEEEARLLFEVDRDPILLLSTDGRFIDGNEAAAKAFGVASRAKLVGCTPVELSPEVQPDGQPSLDKAAQVIQAAFRQGSTEFEWTHRRTDGSEFVAEIALTAIPSGGPPLLMAHLRDITARQQAQEALVRRMRLEQVILDASTCFINVPLGELDHEIDRTLEKLGRFAGADRAYVFQRRRDEKAMDCTHEWCREGVSAQIDRFQDVAADRFPWFAARLLARDTVLVPRVRDLPSEAAREREEFARQDVESMICVPMVLEDQVVGFLGFDSVHAEDAWSDETVTLLRVAADAITNALARRRAAEALRESEERYRSLVEATSDWIWEVDADGVYTYASPKVRDLLGYEPEEVVGRTPFDLMPPEEAQRVAEAVRANFEQALPISQLPNVNVHRDGHEVVLQTSGVPLFDDQGAFRGFRGIDRDITEQKRAAEALQESEERYRSLVETTSDWIWEVDADGVYTYASPKVRDLLGYEPDEVVGKTPFDLMPPEEAARVRAVVQASSEQATSFSHLENRNLHKDGREVVLETSAVPVIDERGELVGFRGIDRDITEQKHAAEALRESEERYRQFLRISAEGIWRLEAVPPIPTDLGEDEQAELILERTRVAECNETFARRYGFRRSEEMVGARLDELWVETRESKLAAVLAFIRGGYRVTDLETSGQLLDGTRGHFLDNLVGLVEEGLLTGAWGTERDVTQRRRAQEALRESEERFRAIVESTRDWIWFADTAGIHRYSNRAVHELLGYTPEEIVDRPIFHLMHPEDAPRGRAQMEQAIAGRCGWSGLVVRWRHQNGTYRYLESAASPAFSPTGELLGWYGADRDITERIEAEEAVRESEAQYRALFEMLPVTVVLHQDRRVALANPASLAVFRTPDVGSVVGGEVSLFFADEARARIEERLRARRRGGPETPDHYFTTLRRADGEEFPAEVFSGATVYQGRPATQVVVLDITERLQMEQALRESEARLRALFAAMSDVIFVLDFEGRYLEIAPTQPDLLYRPAEELSGRTVHEIFPPEQADFFLDAVRRVLTTGETQQIEYPLLIGGREFRFVATLSLLSPDSVMVVARDVTVQVEQYERLLAAERARATLAEHLNEEINHRARNNLAMVSGLLQMQALQEPDPGLADRLREAVARIRTFVDIHEKIYATGAEEVDLTEVLRQVAATLRSVYASVGAAFSVEGDPVPCPTRAATNLAVATNELVTNALKYGAPGPDGTLHMMIQVERADGQVRLSVWNSGNPVPDGFDPAAQHGMGLRLVSDMAQQYGGRFRVVPQHGGTLAELSVPEDSLAM